MLLIGSHAAIINGLHVERKPADIDLMLTPGGFQQLKEFLKDDTEKTIFIDKRHVALKMKSGEIIEIEIAWPDSSSEWLLKNAHLTGQNELKVGEHEISVNVPSLNVLL